MQGSPAARGSLIERGRRLLWGSSRCAGCSIGRGRRLLWGVSHCARLLGREREGAAWGELPLRGAAR